MIRSDMRGVLRGWLQEAIADQWQNTDLDRYLNLGVREVQKLIVSLEPESIKKTYTAHLTAGVAGADKKFSYPVGTWGVIELGISSDGVNYTAMRRISLAQARSGDYTEYSFVPWSPRLFALFPAPTAAVTNGLRAIVVPTLMMAVDTDSCPVQPAYDTLVIKEAERFALRDRGEPTDKLDAEIQTEKAEAPRHFWTSTEPAFITPVISRYL